MIAPRRYMVAEYARTVAPYAAMFVSSDVTRVLQRLPPASGDESESDESESDEAE